MEKILTTWKHSQVWQQWFSIELLCSG